jgi:hypothetical protein
VGYGGPTWDTAGTLTVGTDNTFDTADSTEDGPVVYNQAWWKFTPGLARVTLTGDAYGFMRVYSGASLGGAVEVAADQSEPVGLTFYPEAGIEYHVLLGIGQFDPPLPTYTIEYERFALTAGPWLDDLQDDPDNYLIVTDGDLRLENPNPDYSGSIFSRPEWMDLVARSAIARDGTYNIVGVVDGEDPVAGLSCAVDHALNGDNGNQLWNGSTDDPDDTSPGFCRVLFSGPADPGSPRGTTYLRKDYDANDWPVAPVASAQAAGPSYNLFLKPVRDYLPVYGALPDSVIPNPEDYGYPADAVLEWEDSTAELLGVELADGDPLDEGAVDDDPDVGIINNWALNDFRGPIWDDFDEGLSDWKCGGIPSGTTGVDDRPWVPWQYIDGDTLWQEIPDSAGWDGHDWTDDHEEIDARPDGVVVAWPVDAGVGMGTWERNAHIAVKFNLRAPRFRFIYEGVPPVTRQLQRGPDARGLSTGTRLFPAPQSGRVVGGHQ